MRRGVALSLIAFVVAAGAALAHAQSGESIRVGFMAPLTGIFAQAGQDMQVGLRLAVEHLGHQASGRKIEVIAEDTEGNPAKAMAKYRKLVSQDRIHVLAGILLSNIGYTYPMVSQFWTYRPDDLLKLPPYTRDHPPAKP